MAVDNLPDDALLESYRQLRAGGGFDIPSMDDHREAARALIAALLNRGWTIYPPAWPSNSRSNTTQTRPPSASRQIFRIRSGLAVLSGR
jgi:hypothetical protein